MEAEGEHLSADNAERVRELTGVDRVAALAALPAALRGAAVILGVALLGGCRSQIDQSGGSSVSRLDIVIQN